MNLNFIDKDTEKLHYDFNVHFVKNMRKLRVFWGILIVWNIVWIALASASWRYVVFGSLAVVAVFGFWWTTYQIKRAFANDKHMHMQERLITAFATEVIEERRRRNA